MLELVRHIEWLLQDNDCVIVPGLGGFIAHYTPAKRVEEENCFLPPMRIVGFNPQLTLNDGLLVQSYMAVHKLSFAKAAQKVSAAINGLLVQLHETGKARIGSIGELHLSIQRTYSFVPFECKLSTATLYGLAGFEMRELKDFKQPVASAPAQPEPVVLQEETSSKFRFSYLVNAAAMIALIVLFFFLPTPVENTEITGNNYARLLPADILEKLEQQSLAITPITIKNKSAQVASTHESERVSTQNMEATPTAVKAEATVPETTTSKSEPKPTTPTVQEATSSPAAMQQTVSPSPRKRYHIIVASVGTENAAKTLVGKLAKQGYKEAKVFVGNGKVRVSLTSFEKESEAYRYVNQLRQQEAYEGAWVLTR